MSSLFFYDSDHGRLVTTVLNLYVATGGISSPTLPKVAKRWVESDNCI